MTTYYRIEWPWITLHAGLTMAGTLFLAITMYKAKHSSIPIWKTNSLALFSCSAEIADVLAGDESLHVMEEKASHHYMRLFELKKYHQVDQKDIEQDVVRLSLPVGLTQEIEEQSHSEGQEKSSWDARTELIPRVEEQRQELR
jgi:hypothetical protein